MFPFQDHIFSHANHTSNEHKPMRARLNNVCYLRMVSFIWIILIGSKAKRHQELHKNLNS